MVGGRTAAALWGAETITRTTTPTLSGPSSKCNKRLNHTFQTSGDVASRPEAG